jgi:hypothetical protein
MFSCTIDDDLPGDGDGDEDIAAKYIGTWKVYEPDKKLNYIVDIVRYNSSNTKVLLNNFADLDGNVFGLCTGNNILIENQNIGDYQVEGSGHLESINELTFTYTFSDGIDSEVKKAYFTKE